jgi:hypothetical protein
MTEPLQPDVAPEPPAAPVATPIVTDPVATDPAAVDAPATSELTIEDYKEMTAKLRKEAATYRTKARELEPKASAYDEAVEAQKSEIQRATERATAAEQTAALRERELNLLRAAAKHGIPEEDYDLLGSGTPEELDARAARIASLRQTSNPTLPPPSNRPVEGLRPGASPTPPPPADTSYPAAWRPSGTPERS